MHFLPVDSEPDAILVHTVNDVAEQEELNNDVFARARAKAIIKHYIERTKLVFP